MGLNETERVKEEQRRLRLQILQYAGMTAVVLAGLCGGVLLVAHIAATTREDYLTSGHEFVAHNQYPEAIIEYLSALELDASYAEARAALADAYLHEGQLPKAIDEAVRTADAQPEDIEAQLRAARFLLLGRRFEDAIARADGILQRDASHVRALIARTTAVARMIDVTEGLFQIEPAIRIAPADSRSSMLDAMQGTPQNVAEAEAGFARAVESGPSSVDALQALAAFYWKTGRLAEAETLLRRAVHASPGLGSQRLLAAYLVFAGRPAEAEAALKATAGFTRSSAAQLTLADYYVSQERIDEARAVLGRVAHRPDAFAGARIRLARLDYLHRMGGAADAHAALGEVLAKAPKNVDALLLKAQFLRAERDGARAVQVAEEAVAAQPGSADARNVLADVYADRGDFAAAIQTLNEALTLNPALIPVSLRLSQLHLQRRDVRMAVRLADDAVRAAPASVAARLVRARAMTAQGAFAEAEADLAVVAQQAPNLAAAHVQRGELELRRENRVAARRAFQRALDLDASSLEALRGLVSVDVIDKHPERALALVERRLATSPDDGSILMLAASLHRAAGDIPRLESSLIRVIQRDPGNQPAFVALANLYVERKRLDQALARFQELSRGPGAAGAQTMVGLILEAQNKPLEAKAAYERALATAAGSAVAANNLAWLYTQAGENLDSALNFAQTAVRLRPDSPAFNDTLGWIYLEKKLPEAALQPLALSVDAAPEDPQYRYHLGLAYAQAGEKEKAARELAEALKQKPGYRNAELALQSLTAPTPQ